MSIQNEILKGSKLIRPLLGFLLEILKGRRTEAEAYLVGGALRDAFAGREAYDYDIALGDARIVAGLLKEAVTRKGLSSTLVTMGEKREQECYRFVIKSDDNSRQNMWVDLIELQGNNIYDDLKVRDFTVNAMALPLGEFVNYLDGCFSIASLKEKLTDPYKGLVNIYKKRLCAVSDDIFINDPLRLWRLWRLAAELDFQPCSSTLKLVARDAHLCTGVSGERVRSELLSLLSCRNGAFWLARSYSTGLPEHQFPVLKPLAGCEQNGYHNLNVRDHSILAMEKEEELINGIINGLNEYFSSEQVEHIKKWLLQDNNLPVLKLTALLHDIGKPLVQTTDEEGRIRFFGHEKAALPLLNDVMKTLRLSSREKSLIKYLVMDHLRIFDIITKGAPKTKLRYWHNNGEDVIGLLLLGCADTMTKSGPRATAAQDETDRILSGQFPDFLNIWINDVKPIIALPPLLNGQDIMKILKLPPGKEVGRIKELLAEARLEGTVTDRNGAMEFILKKQR